MKKFTTALSLLALIGLSATPAFAGEAGDISFGADVRTSYELKFVTASDKPVIQPHATYTINEHCSATVWASIGVERAGNELDLIGSCNTPIGRFNLETYDIPGGSDFEIKVGKYQNSFGDLKILAQYMAIDNGQDGYLGTLAHPVYKHDRYIIGAATHFGKAPFSGKNFGSIDGNLTVPMGDNVSLTGLVRHTEGGPDEGTRLMGGISLSY